MKYANTAIHSVMKFLNWQTLRYIRVPTLKDCTVYDTFHSRIFRYANTKIHSIMKFLNVYTLRYITITTLKDCTVYDTLQTHVRIVSYLNVSYLSGSYRIVNYLIFGDIVKIFPVKKLDF